jgi:pimeloyl-ACP methyl ester carboxylesterase
MTAEQEPVAPSLAGREVLFVAGFLNEAIPGYFAVNAKVSRELGATTSVLAPPSSLSLEDNTALVVRELERLTQYQRGLVLLGHSMGGASSLLAVLEHPELVLDGRVECVIVVQGAIGGSPLADTLSPLVPSMQGLESLSTTRAAAVFDAHLAALDQRLSAEDRARFFSRVFYVRSFHADGSVAAELMLTERVLRRRGPNDGLLVSDAMRLPDGVDLGALEADHASLTVSGPLSARSATSQRRFTLALYAELGRRLGWPALAP